MNDNSNDDIEFESALGTVEYWNEFYNREINSIELNKDSESQIWFGIKVQQKIVKYISEKYENNKQINILDIGCGNGLFLLKLYEIGFKSVYGMDYSAKSIDLAKKLIEQNLSSEYENIKLFVEDICKPIEPIEFFDIICDKGTFDAFMLFKENTKETYIEFVLKKIKPTGGKLIITSCNHTKSELIDYFSKSRFSYIEEIEHQKLVFGGSTGQTQSTLIFNII
jgi:2-polyprenyl-3-methyl-5-hydroxy-6-metoxy-1,4-benzoquinol methylase